MTYAKQTWINGEAGATPLSAERLNHMEDGILGAAVSLNVKSYGAVGDGVERYDATTTAGSTAFTSAGAHFTASDVGKVIVIESADGPTTPLTTTIVSVESSTSVTMATPAGRDRGGDGLWCYGTDDSDAINAAIGDALNLELTGSSPEVVFPTGLYLMTQLMTSMSNSIGVTLRGTGRPIGNQPLRGGATTTRGRVTPPTEVRYVGAFAGPFVSAPDSISFTIERLAVRYLTAALTSDIVDVHGTNGDTPTILPKFVDSLIAGVSIYNSSARSCVNLHQAVWFFSDNTSYGQAQYATWANGMDGFSNAHTFIGGFFDSLVLAAHDAVGYGWQFLSVTYEPTNPVTASGQVVNGPCRAGFWSGCGFWDSNGGSFFHFVFDPDDSAVIDAAYFESQGADIIEVECPTGGTAYLTIDRSRVSAVGGTPTYLAITNNNASNKLVINQRANNFSSRFSGSITDNTDTATVGTGITSNVGGSGGGGSTPEAVTTVAASGAAQTLTLDPAEGVGTWDITLTANCTLDFAGAEVGTANRITILLRQDSTGSRTVAWPANVAWPAGTAPTLTTTADHADIVTLRSPDGGVRWFAEVVAQNYPPPPPFAPSDLTNLAVWLKADSLAGADLSTVTTWADQSGHGRDATAAVGSPALRNSGATIGGQPLPNGKAVVYFPGTASMRLSNPSYSDVTVFVVARTFTAGDNRIVYQYDGTEGYFLRGAGSPQAQWFGGSNALETATATTVFNVHTLERTGTDDKYYMDGTLAGTAAGTTPTQAAGTTNSNRFYLGANNAGGSFWEGWIAEVIVYDRALTGSERLQVEAYLRAKYSTP